MKAHLQDNSGDLFGDVKNRPIKRATGFEVTLDEMVGEDAFNSALKVFGASYNLNGGAANEGSRLYIIVIHVNQKDVDALPAIMKQRSSGEFRPDYVDSPLVHLYTGKDRNGNSSSHRTDNTTLRDFEMDAYTLETDAYSKRTDAYSKETDAYSKETDGRATATLFQKKIQSRRSCTDAYSKETDAYTMGTSKRSNCYTVSKKNSKQEIVRMMAEAVVEKLGEKAKTLTMSILGICYKSSAALVRSRHEFWPEFPSNGMFQHRTGSRGDKTDKENQRKEFFALLQKAIENLLDSSASSSASSSATTTSLT
eukprot:CAMPEP_0182519440 /NCGR_PEP_ID=MMETSP1321-20130603/45101_1 /TAXON_ID=91990 /ORGANISM="Bolidomonas sp., Strain RCC1657" /LENGTH=309 /DNA_ID=CAMNT_0024727417 /DNA_START=526 /DNA_END=1453 /DNA_ORIENTATION=+